MTVADVAVVNIRLKRAFLAVRAPIMDLVAAQTRDPFRILVGTILSARTKDACTAGACERLFAHAATAGELRQLSLKQIEKLIFPVGFYHTKARMLQRLPEVLEQRFGGRVPATIEELCELPGVGRKTANLVVALGFGKPAICVDVHVHRIVNRLGLIATRTPFETEMALRQLLPVRYWRTWNSYLVSFGQTRCLPRRPRCEGCPIRQWCDTGRASQPPDSRQSTARRRVSRKVILGDSCKTPSVSGRGGTRPSQTDAVRTILNTGGRGALSACVHAQAGTRAAEFSKSPSGL